MIHRKLTVSGRILIGLSVSGLGLLHFFLPGLRPILAPISPDMTWSSMGHLAGVALTLSGISLVLNKATRTVSLFLAAFFFLFFLFGHLPNRIKFHPEILAYWTDAIKMLAMSGGALVMSTTPNPDRSLFSKIAINGKYFFALMLVLFGVDHFLYVEHVHRMVPGWIPSPVLWTYVTGIALAGSGLAVLFNIGTKVIPLLLAVMLTLWLILIHFPDSVRNPLGDGGTLVGLITCTYFIGIAMLLAGIAWLRDPT